MTMQTKTYTLAAAFFVAALGISACKQGDKPEDALAADTSLAHDIALANADTMSQPQLKDVPVTTVPAESPAGTAPRATRKQTPAEILTPSRNPRRVATTPRTTPEPVNTTPGPVTTANGNTVTEGNTGSERAAGTIA